jgi:hypothetical protein
MSTHKSRDLTDAIVDALELAGLVVGRGIKPATGAGWQGDPGASTFIPYVVVHPSPGGVYDGSLETPFDDAQPDYVVSAIAATQTACQVTADAAFAVLLTAPSFVMDGRVVQLAEPDVDGGVVRDDDVQPPVYYSPTRWRFYTTSA